MSTFTFTHHRVSARLPHRDRRTIGPALVLRDNLDVECWVSPTAERGLLDAMRCHRHVEWMGLLSGRVFQDANGTYVVIAGAVAAETLDSSAGHVRCGDDEFGRLARRLPRLDPAGELIGWWHSHTGHFGYSGVDRNEQKLWTNHHSIGLLLLPATRPGAPTIVAYRGPDSIEMSAVERTAPMVTTPAAGRRPLHELTDAAPPAARAPAATASPDVAEPARRSTRFDIVLGIVFCMSAVALIMSIIAFSTTRGEQVVAAIPQPTRAPTNPPPTSSARAPATAVPIDTARGEGVIADVAVTGAPTTSITTVASTTTSPPVVDTASSRVVGCRTDAARPPTTAVTTVAPTTTSRPIVDTTASNRVVGCTADSAERRSNVILEVPTARW